MEHGGDAMSQRQGMGHRHNLIRSSHNKDTHKYEKQKARTAKNKTKHYNKATKLKAAADKRRAARHEWLTPLCWIRALIRDEI